MSARPGESAAVGKAQTDRRWRRARASAKVDRGLMVPGRRRERSGPGKVRMGAQRDQGDQIKHHRGGAADRLGRDLPLRLHVKTGANGRERMNDTAPD